MWGRARRYAAAFALAGVILAPGVAQAQNVHYIFTKIADSTQLPSVAQASCAAINLQGNVIFVTSDSVLWRGNGITLTPIVQPDSSGQPLTAPCPGTNDNDDLVYAFASTSPSYVSLRRQTTAGITELARSDSGALLYAPGANTIHSLSNDGRTVIAASDGMLYVLPDGTSAFEPDPTLSSLLPGTMNDGHVVVFRAVRQGPSGQVVGIYRGSATPFVEEGTNGVELLPAILPVINQHGTVAFIEQSTSGVMHVWSTTDGVSFLDHTGPLATSAVPDISIALDGLVAFTAAVGGGMGAFVGPDAIANKVLAPGDALDGSTVVTVKLWPGGMSAYGLIAVWVQLADGRTGIYRAQPILAPVAQDGALDDLVNTPVTGTLVATDPANQPLTFSIRTNGAKGTASITNPATGEFVYTPSPNALGSDAFTFEASNGFLTSNVATIAVTIAASTNRPPVANAGGSGPVGSVRFDSVADELSRTTNLPPITGFTMMGWFRVVGNGSQYSAFLRLGDATTSDGYNVLLCCAPSSSNLYLWNGAGIRNAGALTVGQWVHLALSVEGSGPGQVKVYKDGALAFTGDGNPNVVAERLSIGNDAHLEWLNGNAASVKVYDVPLSESEIAIEMVRFEPVRMADLNSWYPLQTAESAATDFSTNGRLLTAEGPLAAENDGPPLLAAITNEDVALTGALQASDPDGNSLTFSLVTNGTKGYASITNAATGEYTYSPSAGATGVDVFTFKANDGLVDSNVGSVPVLILPSTFPLTVTVTNAGSVKIAPPFTTCTTSCSMTFQRDTSVTLTGTPTNGYAFTGWSGACSGTGVCTVVVNGPASVSATFAVASRDLTTASITDPPAMVQPGALFSTTVTTLNQGNVSAGGSSTRFYLSRDSVKDAGDLLLTSTLSVPTLNAGASSTGTLNLTVPTSTALGLYSVLACADDRALIVESSETNNCLASTNPIDVQRPDLIESSLTNPPANIAPGGSFAITDTVENRGRIASVASITRYYLSLDASKSADDILFAATRSVPSLAAGASSTSAKTLVVSTTTPLGTYTLIACADGPGSVIETDETNNCASSASTIQVGRPDLVEMSLGITVAAVSPGASFLINETVANVGNAPSGSSTTRYYLSPDGQVTQGVLLAATRFIGSIVPGGSSAGSKSVMVPTSITVGTYYVLACSDDLNVVTESIETNNCLATTSTILIGWPDIVVSVVANPPVEIMPGKSFTMTDTTINQGNVAAIASTTRYYLSLDGTRDATDILLVGSRAVPSLGAGVSSSASVLVTVPATTPLATYLIVACSDDLSKVAEGPNESNNCTASTGTVAVRRPDLVQSSISNPPASLALGSTFSAFDTVTNQGTIGVGATTTRYYFSVDGSIVGATLLTNGARTVTSLLAGASQTGTRAVTVPAAIALGDYYLVACADDTKVAVESNETNNCLASATIVSVR